MDDGCWTGSGIRIATNSFQLEDIERLSEVLNFNYNLKTTIQKLSSRSSLMGGAVSNQPARGARKILYSLYIKKQSVENIREILLPYMHSSMFYKLGIDNTI